MSRTELQNDQSVNEAALPVLRTAARTQSKDILSKVDQNFGSPLRLFASNPSDSKLNIAAQEIQMSDGTGVSVPPISSQINSFAATTIDFQTGTVTGGTVTITLPSGSTTGYYRRVGFTLLTGGVVQAVFSAEAATLGAVANAGTLFIAGGVPIGWVDIQATASSAYKTANSATSIIENSVSGTSTIHMFGSGGAASSGSGSGIGDDLNSMQFDASFSDNFDEFPTATLSAVDSTKTNATYDATNGLYKMSYDASKTMTTTGTAATASGAPAFTVAAGDVVISGGYVRRIASLSSQTSYTLESAFPADLATAACTISQAVHSKDIYGTAFSENALSSYFSASFSEILVDYEDTSTVSDGIFDVGTAPVVAYAASPDSTAWTAVYTRPTLETSQISGITLPSAGTALYLRFFANKSSGSGTVNILRYKAFMQRSLIQSAGGTLNSAIAFLNGVGTPVNCSVGLSGGKTTITLNFSYALGVNSGSPYGSLDVYIDGKLIPRFVDATLTPDGSYTEISPTVIKLDKDYSAINVSCEVVQRVSVIDTSSQTSLSTAALKEINQIGHQPFVNNVSNMLSATSSTPTTGQFWSTVVNRAAITDISQDLKVSMGNDRTPVQQIYALQNEFGSNGERVWAAVNDDRGLIRFIGAWSNNTDSSGQYVSTVTTNDFIEVTFYGTGLQMLIAPAASMDFRITTDNGAEGSNLAVAYSTVLNARNYNSNTVIALNSGLTLGIHTVKIRNNASAGLKISGFQVLNESSTLKINSGIAYANGAKLSLLTQQSLSYNSGFESGSLGTKGGHALVYLKSDGTIGKAITPTDTSQLTLTSANHANEEVARVYNFREFGANRSDDFSLLSTTQSSRAFTLDDGVHTLVGSLVRSGSATEGSSLQINATSGFIAITFVGTGLDITQGGDYGSSTIDANTISIDGGASIGSMTTSGAVNNPDWKKNIKIVSGLPYGTHTVRFTRTAVAAGFWSMYGFTVYQPKRPPLPSGATELSDYNILANYVANTVQGTDYIGVGVLRKSCIRENTCVGTFTATQNITSVAGHYVNSTTTTNYIEYLFYGAGFEWRFHIPGAVGGNYTVSVDGSSNLSGFTTGFYGTGVGFTAATGVITTGTANTAAAGLSVSGITLGWHTVKVLYNSGSSFTHESFDIITPIHSHKPNIAYDQQNTLPVGSCSLSDNRVFTPTKDLGAKKKNVSQAFGVTSDPTTSASWPNYVPMADMSVVHSNSSGRIRISYSIAVQNSSAGGHIYPVIFVDGLITGIQKDVVSSNAGEVSSVSDAIVVNVSIGIHKIDIYWSVNTGTGTVYSIRRNMLVEEI